VKFVQNTRIQIFVLGLKVRKSAIHAVTFAADSPETLACRKHFKKHVAASSRSGHEKYWRVQHLPNRRGRVLLQDAPRDIQQ
jgi:hypothetical protein